MTNDETLHKLLNDKEYQEMDRKVREQIVKSATVIGEALKSVNKNLK